MNMKRVSIIIATIMIFIMIMVCFIGKHGSYCIPVDAEKKAEIGETYRVDDRNAYAWTDRILFVAKADYNDCGFLEEPHETIFSYNLIRYEIESGTATVIMHDIQANAVELYINNGILYMWVDTLDNWFEQIFTYSISMIDIENNTLVDQQTFELETFFPSVIFAENKCYLVSSNEISLFDIENLSFTTLYRPKKSIENGFGNEVGVYEDSIYFLEGNSLKEYQLDESKTNDMAIMNIDRIDGFETCYEYIVIGKYLYYYCNGDNSERVLFEVQIDSDSKTVMENAPYCFVQATEDGALCQISNNMEDQLVFFAYSDKEEPRFDSVNNKGMLMEKDTVLVGNGRYIRSEEISISMMDDSVYMVAPLTFYSLADLKR